LALKNDFMDMQLERLMKLIKKTGDKLVVLDPKSDEPYVLMGVEAYENLVGVSDDRPVGDQMASIGDILREQAQVDGYIAPEKKSDSESEIVPGVHTEIVEMPNKEKEENPQSKQNYYFEDLEEGQETEKNEDESDDLNPE